MKMGDKRLIALLYKEFLQINIKAHVNISVEK